MYSPYLRLSVPLLVNPALTYYLCRKTLSVCRYVAYF